MEHTLAQSGPVPCRGANTLFLQARGLNKNALPFLVATKFDVFHSMERDEQEVRVRGRARECGG